MLVDPFLQIDLQKEKVKQASEQREQHQLGALKELNKMQGFAQVGFSVGSNPRVFHCSRRCVWNYHWKLPEETTKWRKLL